MTLIRFQCAECGQVIEAPVTAQTMGVTCPACALEFKPSDFTVLKSRVEDDGAPHIAAPRPDHSRRKNAEFAVYSAKRFALVSSVCLVVALMGYFIGEPRLAVFGVWACSTCLVMSFGLGVIGLLMKILLAIEKR